MWLAIAATVGFLIWRDLTTPRSSGSAGSAGSSEPPPSRPASDAAVPSDASLDAGEVLDSSRQPDPPDAQAPSGSPLYTVTEALDDVLSGPLVFVGTGAWFGNYSIHACAYRNERVMVVNVYCTAKETPAFGLVVLSPSRGRVHVYVEADGPISTLARGDYATFRVEAHEPVAEPLSLSVTYADLNAWEERRYSTHSPACTFEAGRAACSSELESLREAWAPAGEAFLAAPPPAWFQLVKDLHARAVRDLRRRSK